MTHFLGGRGNQVVVYCCSTTWILLRDAVVAFSLVNSFLGATIRQFGWMLKGVEEVAADLDRHGIPFMLVRGDCGITIPRLVKEGNFGQVVCDFSPLRIGREWRDTISTVAGVAVHEVDARNVVPAWIATDKIEYGARTIRPKIHRLLGQYLTEFPPLTPNTVSFPGGSDRLAELARSVSTTEMSKAVPLPPPAASAASAASSASEIAASVTGSDAGGAPCGVGREIDWTAVHAALDVDRSVPEVTWLRPGQTAGLMQVQTFLQRIMPYDAQRNDPTKDATSVISPYLHFGNLSSQRAALLARAVRSVAPASVDGFIEEMVVRRELADNYVLFNIDGYDRIDGLYPQFGNDSWAQKSLRMHAADARSVVYTQEQLEAGETHDPLWNAAQAEMVHRGHMPGFNRMYWAKSEHAEGQTAIAYRNCALLFILCLAAHDMSPQRSWSGRLRLKRHCASQSTSTTSTSLMGAIPTGTWDVRGPLAVCTTRAGRNEKCLAKFDT